MVKRPDERRLSGDVDRRVDQSVELARQVSEPIRLAQHGSGPGGAAVERGAALVPSGKKMGGPGQPLDIPLGHKDAAFVRSHFDGMVVQLNDAPRAGEIMVAVAVTDSGRPLARVGGLTKDQITGSDGLR